MSQGPGGLTNALSVASREGSPAHLEEHFTTQVRQWHSAFHTVVVFTCLPTLACALVACRAYACQLNIVMTGFGTRYREVCLVSAL